MNPVFETSNQDLKSFDELSEQQRLLADIEIVMIGGGDVVTSGY